MNARALLLPVLLLLCFFRTIFASTTTWTRRSIGVPIWAHAVNSTSQTTLLLSRHVISLINPKSPLPIWRHLLSSPPIAAHFHPHPPTLLLLLASLHVRAYSPQHAAPLWQQPACAISPPNVNAVRISPCVGPPRWISLSTGASVRPSFPTPNIPFFPFMLPPSASLILPFSLSLSRGKLCSAHWCRDEAPTAPFSISLRLQYSLILVLTRHRTLHALSSHTGDTVWSVLIPSLCTLRSSPPHIALLSCRTRSKTRILAYDMHGLLHLQHRLSFRASHVAASGNPLCVRVLDAHAMQHTLFNCTAHYPWLRVSTHVETARWRIALPSASRVVSIATAGQGGIRPAAVRIAGDRRVLFRHVDSSIVLLLSVDHSHVAHATLVDNDGVLRVFRHVGCTPLAAARGDSWFAYVCWRSDVAASEMVILDLYSGAASTVWSSDQTREVRVVRSVRLLQVKVVALHVADSARGITDPGIVMHLADGRVAVVGKRFLDARSPHKMNAAYEAEFLPPYMPVVELKGASRMVQFLGGGSRQVLVSGIEAAGVWEQESSCVVVVAGVDMLLEKVQTQGNFDALPADFGRWAVIVMVLGLMFVFWYSKNERTKASLLRAW